jgi:hypothetical protein
VRALQGRAHIVLASSPGLGCSLLYRGLEATSVEETSVEEPSVKNKNESGLLERLLEHKKAV